METNERLEAVILARVSSREQEVEGYSLPAQKKLQIDYCERKGLAVRKVFTISESAAKKNQRVVFNQMMDYINQNKVKVLVCEKVDRLTRNFKDAVMIDEWLEEDELRQVHLVKDSLVLHKNSRSQEKLNWGMRVIIAKNYIDNLKEEVLKGMNEKLANGWLPGTPPVGYKTTGESGKKIHIVDTASAPLARQMFELYATGEYSVLTLSKKMAELGLVTSNGRPLVSSHLHKLLRHQFYIGMIPWKGVIYEGAHEALISHELFDRVQVLLDGRRLKGPKFQKHNQLFKGLLRCEECSGMITWETHKDRWYGRCKGYRGCGKKRYARQDEVETQLTAAFDKLVAPSPAIIEWVTDALKAKHAEDMGVHDTSVKLLKSKHEDLKRRLDILYDDRLDGRISGERYDAKEKEITAQQKELMQKLDNTDTTYSRRLHKGLDILEASQTAAELYKKKSPGERQALLADLFTDLTLNGKTLKYEYTPLAAAISDKAEKTRLLSKMSELQENGSAEAKTCLEEQQQLIWLGR